MQSGSQLKRWMTGIGLAGVAAGTAIGLAMPEVYASVFPTAVDDNPHLVRMRERYDLNTDQMRLIRAVIKDRQARIMTYVVSGGQLSTEMENTVKMIERQADDRIDAVLDSQQREQYRKDKQLEPPRDGSQSRTRKK